MSASLNAAPITYILTGHLKAEQPLATCSKDLIDREGGSGRPTPIPTTMTAEGRVLYFPATGIKATLRRNALSSIHRHVVAQTGVATPFSLDEQYFLTLGGIKGKGEMDRASVMHEAIYRMRNPLLSLFGAGDAGDLGFVTGRLQVGNAYAETGVQAEVFSGARTDLFYRDKTLISRLSEEDVNDLIARARGGRTTSQINAEVKLLSAQLRKHRDKTSAEAIEIEAKISLLEAEKARVKTESGAADVSVGMPLAGYKAIPAGSKLSQRLHLMGSQPVELGLLIAAFREWSMSPMIGAHAATGCGMVSGFWEVFTPTPSGKQSLGTITMHPFEGVDVVGEGLEAAEQAYLAFMNSKTYDFSIPSVSA